MSEGGGWATRLGFILAAVGSAIGLGNIWRFPYQVHANGGGAFLIPYFAALVLAGIPVLLVEIWLGSETGLTTPLAIREKFEESEFLGWWAVLNGFIVNAYYVVILGWSAAFIVFAVTHGSELPTGDLFTAFKAFLTSWYPVAGVIVIWAVNYVILQLGVEDGLERANKLFVPFIWVLVILLAVRGLMLPSGLEGLEFYLTPDFGALTDPGIWIAAFGQIYFTLSVALGIMITYASYQPEGQDITNNAFIIAFANCGFAFLAGFAIFPYLVAADAAATDSIGLAFVVLPQAFQTIPFTPIVGAIFFLLLTLAGLSSSLSLAEAQVGPLRQKLDLGRTETVNAVALAGVALSLVIALEGPLGLLGEGEAVGQSLQLLGMFDTSSATYTLPMIALGETLIFGWVYGVGAFGGGQRIATAANAVSDFSIPPRVYAVVLQIVVPTALGYTILSKIFADGQTGLIAPLVIIVSAAIASSVTHRSDAVEAASGGEEA
ncbi:sodium-dependent transporter [Halococcoides cellulosivorans]|uniref:Transporter n=1 Tax=Halococcoides cellulosivorans TaxID=1679096 RepID=A0A2R4WXP2_9EURY|nr:sodium-dependent transporter [Halococcoides cellulosivorans]AWB26306.1 sodium-dependent transporter [Halococcoides cellulosivorans]